MRMVFYSSIELLPVFRYFCTIIKVLKEVSAELHGEILNICADIVKGM